MTNKKYHPVETVLKSKYEQPKLIPLTYMSLYCSLSLVQILQQRMADSGVKQIIRKKTKIV